jgi:hypothetical protein
MFILLQIRLLGIPLQANQANFLWQERRRLDCFPELLVFTWRMLVTNEHFLVCLLFATLSQRCPHKGASPG